MIWTQAVGAAVMEGARGILPAVQCWLAMTENCMITKKTMQQSAAVRIEAYAKGRVLKHG